MLCKWYFSEPNTLCFVGHTDIYRLCGYWRRLSFSLLPHHMIEHPYTLQPYTLSSVILLHITIYLAFSTQTCNQAEQQAASAAMSFQFLHIFSFYVCSTSPWCLISPFHCHRLQVRNKAQAQCQTEWKWENIIEEKINGHKHSSKTSILVGFATFPHFLAKSEVGERNSISVENALKTYLAKENTSPKIEGERVRLAHQEINNPVKCAISLLLSEELTFFHYPQFSCFLLFLAWPLWLVEVLISKNASAIDNPESNTQKWTPRLKSQLLCLNQGLSLISNREISLSSCL